MNNAEIAKGRPTRRAFLLMVIVAPVLGLFFTVLWAAFTVFSIKLPENGPDPMVVKVNISYTLIPFGVGIAIALIAAGIAAKRRWIPSQRRGG